MAAMGTGVRSMDEIVLPDRRRRVLLAAALVILLLGLAHVVSPALGQAATISIRSGPTQAPPQSVVPAAAVRPAPASASRTKAKTKPTTAAAAVAVAPAPGPAPDAVLAPTAAAGASASATVTATTIPSVLTIPPVRPTSPEGYGCAAALAYLAANQAPGFVDVCLPRAAGPGRAGFTVADTQGWVTTGTVYISCPAPIVYQNEASNSWKFSGAAVPLDPWGGVPVSQCRPGDIEPG
jgi:hypothetical protein